MRLGWVLVVCGMSRVFRNGWEEGTLQEGMKSLGRDESLHGNVSTFFDGVQEKKIMLVFVRENQRTKITLVTV